jgi:hypothetical protein
MVSRPKRAIEDASVVLRVKVKEMVSLLSRPRIDCNKQSFSLCAFGTLATLIRFPCNACSERSSQLFGAHTSKL